MQLFWTGCVKAITGYDDLVGRLLLLAVLAEDDRTHCSWFETSVWGVQQYFDGYNISVRGLYILTKINAWLNVIVNNVLLQKIPVNFLMCLITWNRYLLNFKNSISCTSKSWTVDAAVLNRLRKCCNRIWRSCWSVVTLGCPGRGRSNTDESRFCILNADGRRRVWRRQNERLAACCINEVDRWGGANVMIWAAVSFRYKSPPCCVWTCVILLEDP
jgi:hypothetical protein